MKKAETLNDKLNDLSSFIQELKGASEITQRELNLRPNEAAGVAMQFITNLTLCNFLGEILERLESLECFIEHELQK